MSDIQLWGGIECTVNRVGDRWFDQLERSGHRTRLSDLDRFASLGLRALRYPMLWETIAPRGPQTADWRATDRATIRIRRLGMRPIAGLVHHGSGPPGTSLVDDAFVHGLVAHARACAERFPWIEDWTPVNEPLTTARFSALYGHWYPHARDLGMFARALANECRATVLSMRAIRGVVPGARLVQTEDIGTVSSTPQLRYQADYENERRWLSIDLLCGRVTPGSVGWDILRHGVDEQALAFFLDNPCPPDIVGVNYYVTSDRFLDHRLDRHPAQFHGGNGRDRYADVEAVRCREGVGGHRASLLAAAERYRLPVAITECHIDSTREQQLRWTMQAWRAAASVRDAGHDVRAVTLWALNGSYDWNSLVTEDRGYYEPGVFDLRSPEPRPTALARLARALASDGVATREPTLGAPGWWEQPVRFAHQPFEQDAPDEAWTRAQRTRPPILITGGHGTLARAMARACERRGLPYRVLARADLDIVDPEQIDEVLGATQPWAVINAAGFVRVDDAEREPIACFRENALGPARLAEACQRRGVRLLTFSSDLVFDGAQRHPYVESDPAVPLNVYGRSKHLAEKRVLALDPDALVVRTSAFFGPWDESNFITRILRAWLRGEPTRVARDLVVSPTYVPDLVRVCLDALIDGDAGLLHLSNEGQVTWAELAQTVAELGRVAARIDECESGTLGLVALRPAYSALGTERGRLMPPLHSALERYFVDAEDPQGGSMRRI